MKRLFVDTGAWYAVVDKKDPDHKEAEHFLTNNKIPLLTTNFIFDETITLIRSRLGWRIAKDFIWIYYYFASNGLIGFNVFVFCTDKFFAL